MDEWIALDIEVKEGASSGTKTPSLDGLRADAATLQAHFDTHVDHLEEVRQRHTEVLITAGMLPETGLAEHHPERALAWVVEGINGRLNPDSLSIPLLGTDEKAVQLHVKQTQDATLVKLDVEDAEGPNLVRELPLPNDASATLTATFTEGHLVLRW